MSEQQNNQPVPDAVPEPVPVPLPEAVPELVSEAAPEPDAAAPKKKRLRRGRIAAIVCSVVLLGAVIGGTGYTVVTVKDADRDAGAPSWRFPKAAADAKKAKDPAGLRGTLVPFGPDGWDRGPDIAEFGSDTELSGRQATALRKESLRGLPRSQRRRLEKQIDKQHIKGMAMRSYVSTLNAGGSVTVDIVLSQMGDRDAVKGIATFQNELLDAFKIFRRGPDIQGYKKAKCFLNPKSADEKIDTMVCSAYQGEVLVSLTAHAVKPLDSVSVATLLREQLNRIAEPGEAV